jgi:hypothetical protein
MTSMSDLSFSASGVVPKAVAAPTDNTARERHQRLGSGWSIAKNEHCLVLTEPDEFEDWIGEL